MTTLSTLDNMQGVIAFGGSEPAAADIRAAGSLRATEVGEQMAKRPEMGK
jgi:hypothetical protein